MSKGNKFTLFQKKAGKKKAGKKPPFTFGKASPAAKKAAKEGGY